MQVTALPWGTEQIWATTDHYVARTLVLRAGAVTGPTKSLHRDRCVRVVRGTITLELAGRPSRDFASGEVFHVAAGVSHVLRTRVESEIVEISSPAALAAADVPDPEYVIDDIDVTEAPPSIAPPRPAIDRPGAPILCIIEDDLLIQDILLRAFGSTCTIYRADDGEQGLSLVRALPKVDLIITDVMMPKVSGLDFLRSLKADPAKKGIPVIMLTARSASADVAAAINAGARSYVTKPFKLKELVEKVERILGPRPTP